MLRDSWRCQREAALADHHGHPRRATPRRRNTRPRRGGTPEAGTPRHPSTPRPGSRPGRSPNGRDPHSTQRARSPSGGRAGCVHRQHSPATPAFPPPPHRPTPRSRTARPTGAQGEPRRGPSSPGSPPTPTRPPPAARPAACRLGDGRLPPHAPSGTRGQGRGLPPPPRCH